MPTITTTTTLLLLTTVFAHADQSVLSHQFDVTQHLGNLSPYFAAPSHLTKTLPEGCTVDQVSLLHRHGSRFPTAFEFPNLQSLSWLLGNNTELLEHVPPEFEFLKTWTNTLGQESLTAPGRQQLFDHGVDFNLTYPHLFTSLVVAGDLPRVIESAQWFRMGYYGADFASRSTLEKIAEDSVTFSRITPMYTCSAWNFDDAMAAINTWNAIYLPPIAKRLNKILRGFRFTPDDVQGMLYACAYDLAAYGSTPWCDVFKRREILDFEYELDLLMGYISGYGLPGKLGPTLGSVYVNALLDRLTNTTAQMYLDFGHDISINVALTALGIAKDTPFISPEGPVDPRRAWRASHLTPFGARMITERISCERHPEPFVRILLNDAVIPLTHCTRRHARGAPHGACTVKDFIASNAASTKVTREVFDEVCDNTRVAV